MGYIRIETVTNGGERFTFEIESDGLYKINCLSGISVESPDKICEICIFSGILAVRTEDRDLRNGPQNASFLKDDRSENNVSAFDLHGNFLWNIGSITGDIKMPFDSVSCVFLHDAEKESGVSFPGASDVLLRCVSGGFTFIIDAVNKQMLYKISGRVK